MHPKISANLVPDLRIALSKLYSLPNHQSTCTSTQAHEFLLNFQHRNLRRKKNLKKTSKTNSLETLEGSTWFACIDILSSFISDADDGVVVYYEEALFVAQTLVHRLRRVKLSEAIDIECEQGNYHVDLNVSALSIQEVYNIHQYYITLYYKESLGTAVLQSLHDYKLVNTNQNELDSEERCKGELSMIVLMGILNALTKKVSNHDTFSQIQPLIKTLASTLALITARIRYTSSTLPHPAPVTQSCVSIILSFLHMIKDAQVHNNQYLYCICLTALPEAILQNSKNDTFSLDPRCYQALYNELKSEGILQILHSIQDFSVDLYLVQLFESWSRYIPLPIQFINYTIPLMVQIFQTYKEQPQQNEVYKAAMMYYISIMESGSLDMDQIIQSTSKETTNQPNKKRQSSKAKKRQQQHIQNQKCNTDLVTTAYHEMKVRGDVACYMVQSTWDVMRELLHLDLAKHGSVLLGDGPIGAIAAAATACLPHIVRTYCSENSHENMSNYLQLFNCISLEIQNICASPVRVIRGYASESIGSLYDTLTANNETSLLSSLLQHSTTNKTTSDFLEIIIQFFLHSCMNLASQCGYPSDYFNDLTLCYDEEIEEERKSVRDLLRSVANVPSPSMIGFASTVLLRLMQACAQPIQVAGSGSYPETALHAFSALAKPVTSIASLYHSNYTHYEQQQLQTILNQTIEITTMAGKSLLLAFSHTPVHTLLPLTKLYNLTIASLSPMLSTLSKIPSFDLLDLVKTGMEVAAHSALKLPELIIPSTLTSCRSDARGVMRVYGGEDHVGILALMRFGNDTELSKIVLKTGENVVLDLCNVHQELKKMEDARGAGVYHGIGVLPKSRRILLGTICHLELVSGGNSEASDVLSCMFETAIHSISNAKEHLSAETLFGICENTFDVTAFHPGVIKSLFDDTDSRRTCLVVLHQAGNFGYKVFHHGDTTITYDAILQWNRCRAALYTLLKTIGNPDLPPLAIDIMISWIQTECSAITIQCSAGPTSSSKIFHQDVISDETIPPATYLKAIVEVLDRAFSFHTPISNMKNSLHVLCQVRDVVLSTITLDCPMPIQTGSFYDPRPVLAEVWFLCMIKLSTGIKEQEIEMTIMNDIKNLLVKTFVAAVTLLLYSSLEKTLEERAKNPGMSLDGPQGLLMLEFFEAYFGLGSFMLQAAAEELVKVIPVDCQEGMAIIGAILLRIWQGSLPPWAVENVAFIYPPLFQSLNKNVEAFSHLFDISMKVRLTRQFGCIPEGSFLSGEFMTRMSDKAKSEFLNQTKEYAGIDSTVSWKRLKVLIKLSCGGKKKDTDFNQRPALTAWDKLDRV